MKTITATKLQKNYDEVMTNALTTPQIITKHRKPRYILMSYALIDQFSPSLRSFITGEPRVISKEEMTPEMVSFLTSAELVDREPTTNGVDNGSTTSAKAGRNYLHAV